MLYREGPKSCEFRWNRGRLYDAAAAAMLHELCAASPLATVASVEGARKTKWAPVPLSTLEMQKRGSQVEGGRGGVQGQQSRKPGRETSASARFGPLS